MNREEIYHAWKEEKKRIEIREEFSDEVMGLIYDYEQTKSRSLLPGHRLVELVSAHPFVKAAVVTVAAVAGLVRIMFVAYAFLGC